MTQGEYVNELRKSLNLTLEKFDEKLGIKNAISQIVKGFGRYKGKKRIGCLGLFSALFARFFGNRKTLEEKRKMPPSFARPDAIFILFYACAVKTKF